MPITLRLPALSRTMEDATLVAWNVALGDHVSVGDVIAEIETDKSILEIEATAAGVIRELIVPEGREGVKIGAPLALLDEDEMPSPAPPGARAHRPASPLARRIAAERGVALEDVQGSGPNGRIVRADVERATTVPHGGEPLGTAPSPAPAQPPHPVQSAAAIRAQFAGRRSEETRLAPLRQEIAARAVEAVRTIPHLCLRCDVRLDTLLGFRTELNMHWAEKGISVSLNDCIIRAAALALQEVPICNSAWAGDRILRFKASDISVAVAIEAGFISPVIRDAETKPLSAISTEMKALAEGARNDLLTPEACQGGALTISNLGMLGVERFDAVIMPPQGAALAVGAALRKPVATGDHVSVETVMPLSLSIDQRMIDGVPGAALLSAIKGKLETPLSLLL